MKKIKEVKLKQAIQNPSYSIKAGTVGYSLGEKLDFHFKGKRCGELYGQDYMEGHPDWFEITYEPEFKVGDWVKVVRETKGWYPHKDLAMGKSFEIKSEHYGEYVLSFCKNCSFPPESLEPAEKPVEREKITVEIEWDKDSKTSLGEKGSENVIGYHIRKYYNFAKNITVKKL